MKKYIAIVIVVIIIIGAGILSYRQFYANNTSSHSNIGGTNDVKTAQDTTKTQLGAPSQENPALLIGDKSARATIVEYIDFKCPNCAKTHETVGKPLRTEYADKKLIALRVRPIAFIGPDSHRAAEGAYCANDQGKFIQYHDAVFEFMWGQGYNKGDTSSEFKDILTTQKLTELASSHGIDTRKLAECIDNGQHKTSVDADLSQSQKDGVAGTPHTIIGQQKVVGPQSYNTYKTLISIALR